MLICRLRGLTFTWWGCYGLCLWRRPTELAHSFLFCSWVLLFCLYGPFNCILFNKFSRQLSVFSLCSSGLIAALLVLSTTCLFVKVSFSPYIILSDWLGSKHLLINCWFAYCSPQTTPPAPLFSLTIMQGWCIDYSHVVVVRRSLNRSAVGLIEIVLRQHWRRMSEPSKRKYIVNARNMKRQLEIA